LSVVVQMFPKDTAANDDLLTVSARITAVKSLLKLLTETDQVEPSVGDVLELAREHLKWCRDAIDEVLSRKGSDAPV
jgi:hypothetical protein